MDLAAIAVAGLGYFALGGLWFTPLFGRQWDAAVGFKRPPRWRPTAVYYLGPLLGCLAAALASAYLARLLHAQSTAEFVQVGLTVGLGFAVPITAVNAIAPNMPKPGLYAAVVGSYHLAGLVLVSLLLHAMA